MEDNNLFDISFSALQDNDPIEINDINAEVTETPETVEVVDSPTGEQKPEESTAAAKKEQPTKDIKAETEDLIEIETESKDITTSDEDSTETPGQEDTSPITPFASLLQEKGFLHHTKASEIKSMDDLLSAVAKEREAMQADIINSFPPELINMAKAVIEGIPFEQLKDNKVQELKYNSISAEDVIKNVNLQKQLIADHLLERGFKPDKVKNMVERFEDMGEETLISEARDALTELKEIATKKEAEVREQYAKQQKEMEERNKQVIANIEKKVTDTSEILPGRPLTEEMKRKTLDSMLQIVGQDQNGTPLNGIMKARSEDPVAFDMKVAYLMNLTNNFTDFSAIQATAKTSAAKEFEKALSKGNNISGKSATSKQVDNDTVDILEGLRFIK